jgi:hypothetical protein
MRLKILQQCKSCDIYFTGKIKKDYCRFCTNEQKQIKEKFKINGIYKNI